MLLGYLVRGRRDRSGWCLGAFCPGYRLGSGFDPVTRVTQKVPETAARVVLAMAAAR
jgi:hypothetical protein